MERHEQKGKRSMGFQSIFAIVGVAVLSTLGFLLAMLGQVIPYGPLTFLQIEPSDVTVLVAYGTLGFFPAVAVALLKALLQLAAFGMVGAPIPIGNLTAFFTSVLYALGMLLVDKAFHLFDKDIKKGIVQRILAYAIVLLLVATAMSFLNWLFITPTYMVYGQRFLTYWDIKDALSDPTSQIGQTFRQYFGSFEGSYSAIVFGAYFPFNLLKGAIVAILYEIYFDTALPFIKKAID